MSEHLSANNENVVDELQDVLEQGGQSVRDLLERVDLADPEELRQAIRLCRDHLVGKEWANIYIINEDGVGLTLTNQDKLSVVGLDRFGLDDQHNLYLAQKDLNK